MPDHELSRREARRFILAHQGLWPPRQLEGRSGALEYVRRVGCIQYDPLNVVGHNPDLVLQARVADYSPELLESLLYETRELVEGWDKNAAIFPVEDWPYFHRQREEARENPGKSPEAVRSALPRVRQAIEERGPLSSIDLDLGQTVDWSWAPTRLARATLESMCAWGELVIHHRVHTRKIYDFSRRHIADDVLSAPDPNQTEAEYHDWYVLRRIGSVGLLWNRAGDAWLGMGDIKSRERTAALERLRKRGQVVAIDVEGVDPLLYARTEDWDGLRDSISRGATPPRAAILAPLDNLMWDRRLVEELFDFTYVWEVYKPVAERLYGYYVLPILYGDRLVARFEPEKRDGGALVIKGWWWEPETEPSDAMRSPLVDCFRDFMRYLDADTLRVKEQAAEQEGLEWVRALAGG